MYRGVPLQDVQFIVKIIYMGLTSLSREAFFYNL